MCTKWPNQWGQVTTGSETGYMYWTTPMTYNIALSGVVFEYAPQSWFTTHSLSYHGGFGQISSTDKRIVSMTLSHNPDNGEWRTNNASTSILGVFKA